LTGRPRLRSAGCEVINLRLALPTGSMTFNLVTPERAVRLSALVPLCRFISGQIVRSSVDQATAADRNVTCRKGCSACCHYLVPLSIPESLWLYEHVQALPSAQRRTVMRAFTAAAAKLFSGGRLPMLRSEEPQNEQIRCVSGWYRALELTCPLLRQDLCSIYGQRPLACREHLSLTDPAACSDPSMLAGQRIGIPVSLVNCLAEVTAELEQRPMESVLLPLTLHWVRENLGRFRHIWPAPLLVKMLANRVKTALDAAASSQRSCR
jgi:Fe-S-cluster containining protein